MIEAVIDSRIFLLTTRNLYSYNVMLLLYILEGAVMTSANETAFLEFLRGCSNNCILLFRYS